MNPESPDFTVKANHKTIEDIYSNPEQSRLNNVLERIAELSHIRTSVGIRLTRITDIPGSGAEDLVVYRNDNNTIGNPAGRVEPGESLLSAIIRETYEETGIIPTDYFITGIIDALLIEEDKRKASLRVIYQGYMHSDPTDNQRILKPSDPDNEIEKAMFLTKGEIELMISTYRDKYPGAVALYEYSVQGYSQTPEEIINSLQADSEMCNIPLEIFENL